MKAFGGPDARCRTVAPAVAPSKRPAGPALTFGRAEWASFIDHLR